MLMKSYQLIFLSTLMTGTVVAISASNWFTAWLGLEINLLSFIPLLMMKLNSMSTETAIKYFLAQALASTILIFSSLFESAFLHSNMMLSLNTVILLALMIKAGLPPFHYWFPQVMKTASWFQCALILTWQKLAPFILMSTMFLTPILMMVVTLSAIVGALGGLNQVVFKTILTYSSIVHSAWMLTLISVSLSNWMTYFLIYSLISVSAICLMNFTNTNKTMELSNTMFKTNIKITFVMLIMSLGGLPPFLGFFAKLTALKAIMMFVFPTLSLILISASLISLYYYIQMTYGFLMIKTRLFVYMNKKWPQKMNSFFALAIAGNLSAPLWVCLV